MPNYNFDHKDIGLEDVMNRAQQLQRTADPITNSLNFAGTMPLAIMKALALKKQQEAMNQQLPELQGITDPAQMEFVQKVLQARKMHETEAQKQALEERKFGELSAEQKQKHEEKLADQALNEKKIGAMGARGYMSGQAANTALGEQIYPDDAAVSTQEVRIRMAGKTRQKPPVFARTQYLAIKDAEKFIDNLQGEFNKLVAAGKTGGFMGARGAYHHAVASLSQGNSDPEVAAYNRVKFGLVGRLKAVAGEVGRITDQDVARMGKLLANVESGKEAADAAFAQIKSILAGGKANVEEVYPGIMNQIRGGSDSGERDAAENMDLEAEKSKLAQEVAGGKITAAEAAIKLKGLKRGIR